MWVELGLVCIALYLGHRWVLGYRNSSLPGPVLLPLLGNTWHLRGSGGDGASLYLVLDRLAKQYGSIYRLHINSQPIVVLSGKRVISSWKSWLQSHPRKGRILNQLQSTPPPDSSLSPILMGLLTRIRSDMGDGVEMVGASQTLFHSSIVTWFWTLVGGSDLLLEEKELLQDLVSVTGHSCLVPGQWADKGPFSQFMRTPGLWGDGGLFQGVSATLGWSILYLILHPGVQERMWEEIKDQIQSQPKSVLVQPSLKDKLPYCSAVVWEVQRLATVRPLMTPPVTLQSQLELDGLKIPKDARIVVNLYSIHRDPIIFPDPETFSPERFLVSGENCPEISQYFDFDAGFSVQNFVFDAIFTTLATLVANFKLSTVPGHLDPGTAAVPFPGPLLTPKPFNFVIRRR